MKLTEAQRVQSNVTPKMKDWLRQLRDHGPAKRSRSNVGYRCMIAGFTEWDYRWPDGREMSDAEARELCRAGRAGEAMKPVMLERITPAGRATLGGSRE